MSKQFGRVLMGAVGLLFASNGAAQPAKPDEALPSAPAPEIKPLTVAAPLTVAERRLAKAQILAELLAPKDITVAAFVASIGKGFRIGFGAVPENRALEVKYPGLEDAIVLAMQPRARALVEMERGPMMSAMANQLVDQFTITELDQGIRLYRHPVMIKWHRLSVEDGRSEAAEKNLKLQLAKGSADPRVAAAAVARDGRQSTQRALAKLTPAEIRALSPLMRSEFSEKMGRVRPIIDAQMFKLMEASNNRVAADEELRTVAFAAMAEFIAKADAAKPAVSAAIPSPAK